MIIGLYEDGVEIEDAGYSRQTVGIIPIPARQGISAGVTSAPAVFGPFEKDHWIDDFAVWIEGFTGEPVLCPQSPAHRARKEDTLTIARGWRIEIS